MGKKKDISLEEKLKQYEDHELYAYIADGKENSELAFSVLYDRLSPAVWAYCLRMNNNEDVAKDILQDTFIAFYRTIRPDKVVLDVKRRLFGIARKYNERYTRRTRDEVPFDEVDFYQEEYDNTELLDLIKKVVVKLPTAYREIFIMREYDCLSYIEISEITGDTMTNVKVKIHRARAKVKELLKKHIKEMKQLNVEIIE